MNSTRSDAIESIPDSISSSISNKSVKDSIPDNNLLPADCTDFPSGKSHSFDFTNTPTKNQSHHFASRKKGETLFEIVAQQQEIEDEEEEILIEPRFKYLRVLSDVSKVF